VLNIYTIMCQKNPE